MAKHRLDHGQPLFPDPMGTATDITDETERYAHFEREAVAADLEEAEQAPAAGDDAVRHRSMTELHAMAAKKKAEYDAEFDARRAREREAAKNADERAKAKKDKDAAGAVMKVIQLDER